MPQDDADPNRPPLPTRHVPPDEGRSRKPLPEKKGAPKVRSRGTTRLLPGRERGSVFVFEWAVIAVVVGIVLTLSVGAYKKATGAARGTACVSNLQRLGQMFALYLQDYDGAYPPLPRGAATLEEATRPLVRPGEEEAWTVRLASYREQDPRSDPYVCPAAPGGSATYAYNAALGARAFPEYDPKAGPATDASVARPAETFLAWDTANLGTANNLSGCRFFYGAKQNGRYRRGDFVLPSGAIREGWVRPRHNDGANVVYCDGHVRRVADQSVRRAPHDPFDPAGVGAPPTKAGAEAGARSEAGAVPAPSGPSK